MDGNAYISEQLSAPCGVIQHCIMRVLRPPGSRNTPTTATFAAMVTSPTCPNYPLQCCSSTLHAVEETFAEMAALVKEGKIKYVGISEASPDDISRAHAGTDGMWTFWFPGRLTVTW